LPRVSTDSPATDADGAGRAAPPSVTHNGDVRWSFSPATTATVAVAVVLATAGLALARIDLALLALPFAVSAAWAWDRRPAAGERSTLEVRLDAVPRNARLGVGLALAAPEVVDAVILRLSDVGGLGGEPQEVVVTPEVARRLSASVPVPHSGPRELMRVEYRLLGVDAAHISQPVGPVVVSTVIRPRHAAITSLPLPPRLRGLTGSHDSARPGDGGDFRDVHPFAPGDRMRRVDWKATARRGRFDGDLYVRRTAALADATVLIVLDSRDDVGERVVEWSMSAGVGERAGSLDIAREAASSIAAGYIRAGDRVGFQDLATHRRMVTAGGGGRHLSRLLRAIELTSPSEVPPHRQRAPIVTPGALVYVLSTFLDDEAARMAAMWRANGHRVIAVDVLPMADLTGTRSSVRIAHRIVMMERVDRVRALRAQGVDFLRWRDPSSHPEAGLLALTRVHHGRR
jgi:uncharacterized protein (DUF58 family)